MGTPYYRALWNIGMAQVAFVLERPQDATNHIQTAHRISLEMKSPVMEWYSLLIRAYFLLREGKEAEGLPALRRGLVLGKRHGYVHLQFYQPSVMQFLFAKALSAGVEPEYVKGLIRKLKLTPPELQNSGASISTGENWPYPLKIYTLGRFEIRKNEEPIGFAGKVQQKPLELLKSLIAFGGRNVAEERLTDALWPDADGDLAHKSIETTLSRLRRLLGGETFIKYSARQLTINPLFCWVDSLALAFLIDRIRETPVDQATWLCENAVSLYKGPFLPADIGLSCAVPKRETFKNKMLRILMMLGRQCEQAGQWEKAVEHYTMGMDTDDLSEEFYQRLMLCHQRLGRSAEAVVLYHRCCHLLKAELGIGPSPKTTAVYSAIIQK
jgi:DNA-binding SARP family transcriptional activator